MNGELVPAAKLIVGWCDSYTEISISGTGLHIIVKGSLPDKIKNKLSMEEAGFKAIEIYDQKRYFTMTGNLFGEKRGIREININELPIPLSEDPTQPVAKLPNKDLAPLIEQIKQGNDGMLFTALFEHGDLSHYGGDQSRADLGLVNILSK